MVDYIKEIIVMLITGFILYVFILCFLITTFIYFTYRFWKMILSKEEHNIYVVNTPVIGHNCNNVEKVKEIKSNSIDVESGKMLKFIGNHTLLITILLTALLTLIAKIFLFFGLL